MYGYWVVAVVPPEAINELTADLLRARHDPSSNLAGIAFTGAHLVSIGADCTLKNVRECPRTTKLLVAPHPPDHPEKPWLRSASEQALLDQRPRIIEGGVRQGSKSPDTKLGSGASVGPISPDIGVPNRLKRFFAGGSLQNDQAARKSPAGLRLPIHGRTSAYPGSVSASQMALARACSATSNAYDNSGLRSVRAELPAANLPEGEKV